MMPKESEPVKPRTREDVLHNLRSRMERENIDAIVAISPENVQHLTGAFIISQRIIRDRLAFAVCPRVGRPFFVVSSVVERTARTQSSFGEVVAYSEHAVRPIEALCKALDARGLGTGRVCIEMGYLTARDERWLRSDLPEIELLESDRILDQSRMVKTLDEIEIMKRHARLWEESVLEGFFAVQVGEAERAIADRLARNLLSRGADWIPFTSFASGPERTMIAHSVADETPVRRGDIMRVDMVGFFKGYYADFGRMAVVGNPSRSQREAYRRLVALQSETIRHARSESWSANCIAGAWKLPARSAWICPWRR